ncbi:hypothetical protein J7I98_35645 [Streptomyces sp. ISL-98]|uniref:hypothetical protein n=1 Tax=Streptomyces sp. ISL-98 TaxID=2819192 RepID=UPI001BECD3EB|nr:hypothetical protein [Streptomyces sp. ISL-98]MBT2511066.1 hypothetical protein [Streptomyces sp. ISL-98]
MAWLYAEYIGDELLRTGNLIPPGTLEFRAGRETLALTIYLSDSSDELSGIRVVAGLDEWLSLTTYGHPWEKWVRERLADRMARADARKTVDPDLELALASWRWLSDTELLAADLGGALPAPRTRELADDPGNDPEDGPGEDLVDESEKVWMPAWQLGLPLGHLAIHLF